ncbi:MAG: hypothetical protein GY878_13340 [Fuerstiella sp.]|nr:hypothetical protein [Fuerstiella sp.]
MDTGFPFGLWSAFRPVVVAQELLVWPRVVKLDGLPDLTESQSSEEHQTDRQTDASATLVVCWALGYFGKAMHCAAFTGRSRNDINV